jgi:hypothetical protein
VDDQQQRRVNEAAEQFTNALVESFRTVSARGEAAQEQSAKLTEEFFNRVVNNLRTQAQDNRALTQQLADQQQRTREAGEALTRESVGAYMDFVNSIFSLWQGGVRTVERGVRGDSDTLSETSPDSSISDQTTTQTTRGEVSMADISQFVDKNYEQKEFNELADAPVDALQGVSEGDAEKLQQAFNIKTVRDLAENKFVRVAQAIVALSGSR